MDKENEKVKKVKVSAQRHLVIPKEYYDALSIDGEVTIELHENQLMVKPVLKVKENSARKFLDELIVNEYGFK